jgi:chromosomal replication initiator protein
MHGRDRCGATSSELDGELKRGAARTAGSERDVAATIAAHGGAALDAWQRATPLLRSRFGESNFGRWLAPLSVRGDRAGVALLAGDREQARVLRQHFLPGICEAMRDIGFRGAVSLHEDAEPCGVARFAEWSGPEPRHPDARYTFAEFVVGDSNRFAHDAARVVADRLGREHNPLYLHGGVGLGKTHLATAVAHAVTAARGVGAALAVSADRFASLGAGRLLDENFATLAAAAHLVVFDDVQLLTRGEETVESLLRCLDGLLARGCQVVLTCDLSPPEIPALAVGLKARWEYGLAAEILPPDVALRCEIVRRRAVAAGTPIDAAAVAAIAAVEPSNVRALEGAFNRVRALAASTNRALTAALVGEALAGRVAEPAGPPDLDAVVDAVAVTFGIGTRALRSRKRRDRAASLARQAAVFLARRLCALPLAEIAADLGFRDHSTAAHAFATMRGRLDREPELAARVREIEARLGGCRDEGP